MQNMGNIFTYSADAADATSVIVDTTESVALALYEKEKNFINDCLKIEQRANYEAYLKWILEGRSIEEAKEKMKELSKLSKKKYFAALNVLQTELDKNDSELLKHYKAEKQCVENKVEEERRNIIPWGEDWYITTYITESKVYFAEKQ